MIVGVVIFAKNCVMVVGVERWVVVVVVMKR